MSGASDSKKAVDRVHRGSNAGLHPGSSFGQYYRSTGRKIFGKKVIGLAVVDDLSPFSGAGSCLDGFALTERVNHSVRSSGPGTYIKIRRCGITQNVAFESDFGPVNGENVATPLGTVYLAPFLDSFQYRYFLTFCKYVNDGITHSGLTADIKLHACVELASLLHECCYREAETSPEEPGKTPLSSWFS